MQPIVRNILLNTVGTCTPPNATGRPRLALEQALDAIDFVLRSGVAWRHLSETKYASNCHYTTIHKRFRAWVDHGVFEKAYANILRLDNSRRRRGPRYSCIYSSNQYGRDCLGPNPTDRGRKGTHVSARVNDRGVPVALKCFGANRSDFLTVEQTFRAKKVPLRPRRNFYADKGYDSARIRSLNCVPGTPTLCSSPWKCDHEARNFTKQVSPASRPLQGSSFNVPSRILRVAISWGDGFNGQSALRPRRVR